MADERVLEGLALRRAVAEAQGHIYYPIASPEYDIDLNTLKDAAAMLPETHKLEVRWYPDETIAIVDVVGSISWRVNRIAVSHTEPATAAWNAILRWKAREQEAGNEGVK